ncbi:MAG TPA: CoA transferase [Ilumatobacteraceae bacterium]
MTTHDQTDGVDIGPMDGVRIVDFSIALTGPYAVALLADQGASVVKVERPGIGDIARWIGVSVNGMSSLYQTCNRGKRSIAINLDTAAGVAIAKRFVAAADVVVQNFRPGVMSRLGLGYDDLREDHEDLIYVSLSGFGPAGPYAAKGAYDTVIQAYAGIGANQASADTGEPCFLNQVVADKVTAMYAVQAITAALFARERRGIGQHVQLSMLDSVVSFLWADAAGNEVMLDSDHSLPSSFTNAFRPFRFLDGWGICTPTSDADFAGMCKAMGVDGYDDPRVAGAAARRTNRAVMAGIMARCRDAAATMTTAEAMGRFDSYRVPCGEVLSTATLAADEHVQAIGLLEDSIHPVAGRLRQPRHPAQFAATPAHVGGPAPMCGQDTDVLLAELGLDEAGIAALRSGGAVA